MQKVLVYACVHVVSSSHKCLGKLSITRE